VLAKQRSHRDDAVYARGDLQYGEYTRKGCDPQTPQKQYGIQMPIQDHYMRDWVYTAVKIRKGEGLCVQLQKAVFLKPDNKKN
jgi:hypothetical protein